MKYDYLIAYSFASETSNGIGTFHAYGCNKIKNCKDIESLQEYLKKRNKFKEVAVTNYQIIRRYWR